MLKNFKMRNHHESETIQKEKNNRGASAALFSQLHTSAVVNKFSIVIVVKDAGAKIERLLQSIAGLSDDVIVCDTGSSDNTLEVLKKFPVQVYRIRWKGYGRSKNDAIAFAKYDWILSLDSDEKIDQHLYKQLCNWKAPGDTGVVYQVRWKNFLGIQWIRHSQWGANWKNRLFNKHIVRWDDAIAHEDVCSASPVSFVKFKGYLEHYSFQDKKEYIAKMVHSANITAMKYHEQQRQSSLLHLIGSPLFTYVKLLVFHTAFLDGRAGWLIARTTAYYTYLKYARLRALNQERNARKQMPLSYNYQRG